MFGNSKLKREIARLEDDNDYLRAKRKEWEEARELLQGKVKRLEGEVDALRQNYRDCHAELDKTKSKIRTQNEANLMFVAVKIIAELIKDKKLEDLKDNRNELYAQYVANQQMQRSRSEAVGSLGNLFSILGIQKEAL